MGRDEQPHLLNPLRPVRGVFDQFAQDIPVQADHLILVFSFAQVQVGVVHQEIILSVHGPFQIAVLRHDHCGRIAPNHVTGDHVHLRFPHHRTGDGLFDQGRFGVECLFANLRQSHLDMLRYVKFLDRFVIVLVRSECQFARNRYDLAHNRRGFNKVVWLPVGK